MAMPLLLSLSPMVFYCVSDPLMQHGPCFGLTFLSITLAGWFWDLSGEGHFLHKQLNTLLGPFVVHLSLTFHAL